MNDENNLQVLSIHYPLTFTSATSTGDGVLLESESKEMYLLHQYKGGSRELVAALEAEAYLQQRGFGWILPALPLQSGLNNLEESGQNYYLKPWQPEVHELPLRWYSHLGVESLAQVHLAGEGFHPVAAEGWEWPDWIKLFEMARDVVYEMHTAVINEKEAKLAKYFDRTARDAIRSIEEGIVHLKEAGYPELRKEAIRKGYINLTKVPVPVPGMRYDLVGKITPDLPACGLASFLGQMGDWTKPRMINDIIDMLDTYNRVRRLKSAEIDVIKGFFKFPWQFWWATEDYCLQQEMEKRKKIYSKALKTVFKGYSQEIRLSLQEF